MMHEPTRACFLMVGLLLAGCEPLTSTPPTGTRGAGEDGGTQVDAGDVATPVQTCWQTEELAQDVDSPVFTLDAQGTGHFAYINSNGQVEVGTTAPGSPRLAFGAGRTLGGIAVDGQGTTHVAFSDDWGTITYVIYPQGGGATESTLDGQGILDFALDGLGAAHLLFYRGNKPYLLFHARIDSETVTLTDLHATLRDTWSAALAVDAEGHAHVAYDAANQEGLFYATNARGTWEHERVGLAGEFGTNGPALALGTDQAPRMAYGRNGQLYFAVRHSGGWTSTGVAPGFGSGLDMVVDPQGAAYVAYDRVGEPRIAYTTNAKGSWERTPVASVDVPGFRTVIWDKFIALDARQRLHIAYHLGLFDDVWHRKGTRFWYARPCP